MSRLTPDGKAEPVSRGQILRRERGQGDVHFPCSASRIGSLTRLIHTLLYLMAIHTQHIDVPGMLQQVLNADRYTSDSGLRLSPMIPHEYGVTIHRIVCRKKIYSV